MELLKLLFFKNKEFSWRKALTGLIALTFVTACVGYLIATGFKELPVNYQAIIAGVFVFYFGKGLIEGKKIT
jgi:uncharacterized membrane protein